MRKTAYLIAAAMGSASLALMSFSSVAANASTGPSTAQRATVTTQAAPQAEKVTCVRVRSSKEPGLEHCSVAIALSAASAASRHDGVAFSAKAAGSLTATRSAVPAKASDTSAAVSGGCIYNVAGDQICTWSLNPGPRQACGGFNGNIQWLVDDWGMEWIQTWGEVWSLCAATAYVYLAWNQTDGGSSYNKDAGSASAYSTIGVNNIFFSNALGGPSSVRETVCTTEDGGWHCGAGVYAQ